MRTKPILTIAASLLLCGGLFFTRCSHSSANKEFDI